MKTTFKTLTDSKKANQKRQAFQEKTCVKWDYYHVGKGMRFTPIITKDTPTDEKLSNILLSHLTTNYEEFIKLSESSGLDLSSVLIAAKTLVKNNQAVGTVNRMGHFFAIRTKHKWEK